MKKGFTLLEMIVVIGVIGVLAAVLLSQFGGATESAKAAQCMNNLRSLSVGVINAATANGDGVYPAAHSLKYKDVSDKDGKICYPLFRGWISWTRNGDPTTKTKTEGSDIFLGDDNDSVLFAITNGAIWVTSGKSRSSYTCPIHANEFKKKNGGRMPGWSYVMNDRFGVPDDFSWNMRMDGLSLNRGTAKKPQNTKVSHDKVLLFAEIQALTVPNSSGVTVPAPDFGGTGNAGDAVLKYKDGEVIGFNHKLSGGKYTGHVAFADGHVEKVMLPSGGSLTDLTKWLCEGYDVSFNGKQYTQIQ